MNDPTAASSGRKKWSEVRREPRSRRWMFSRVFRVRRWGIVTHFRAYHGNGSPVFAFEFRFGFPALGPKEPVEELIPDE